MRFFLFIYLVFSLHILSAQQKDYQYSNVPLPEVLEDLEKNFQVKFSYPNKEFDPILVNINSHTSNLDEILQEITYSTDVVFHKISSRFYYLDLDHNITLDSVMIRSFLVKGISLKSSGYFELNLKKLGLIPGNIDADVFHGIQQLPGVYSFDGSAVNLNVHGGKSDYNRILWNGIPIYHRGHLFGMISPFNPNTSQKIDYFYKGVPLKFNNFTSSVMAINTTDAVPEKIKVNTGVNGLDADIISEIPLWNRKLGIIFSARRSYENILKTSTFEKYQEKAFYGLQIDRENYRYGDMDITANYYPNEKNHIKINFLIIQNRFENNINPGDEEHNYLTISNNEGAAITWKNQGKLKKSFGLYYTYYNLYYHHKTYEPAINFTTFIDKSNDIRSYHFQSDFSYKIQKHHLDFGFHSYNKKLNLDFKEYKDIFYHLETQNAETWTHHFYLTDKYIFGEFTFLAGSKFSYYTNLKKIYADPLLSIHYRQSKHWNFQLTYEQQRQDIFQINETFNSNNYYYKGRLWRLADGEAFYPLLRKQITQTSIYQKRNWLINTDIYFNRFDNLSSLYLGHLFDQDNQFQKGTGKSYGIDFFVKKKWKHINLWMKYAYLQSKEKFERINRGKYFASSQQVEHSFNISAIYNFKHFQTGFSWMYRSGTPYTKIINGYLDEDHINEARLPAFHQLNFSFAYQTVLCSKKNIRLKTGFSLRNIYNNHTPIGVSINGKNTLYDELNQDFIYPLPFTPNFMLRLFF